MTTYRFENVRMVVKLEKVSDKIWRDPGQPMWLKDCSLNASGKPLPNLANAMTALRAVMPEFLAFDEMLSVPMLMKPFAKEDGFVPRPVTDIDVAAIQEHLQTLGLERIGKDTMHQAVDLRAYERRFNPVRRSCSTACQI
jgi:hypothetical protein